MRNLDIREKHVTRLEGHGNIVVEVRDGRLEAARFDIVESPRFFEVMLQGRMFHEASGITSRICGICAVAHTLTSLRATEDAFRLAPSEQTVLLRKLILHGETLQSHILHIYFLVAPDLFGVPSVIPLAGTHGEVVVRALRMKKLANDLCAVIGGRHVHPVSLAVNAFTKLPDAQALRDIRARLIEARADMAATVELFKGLKFPDFTRETEYISLKNDSEYAFYSGNLVSSDGKTVTCRDYKNLIKETVIPTSSAKHVSATRESFMVGALARFNNNHAMLRPEAQKAAAELGLIAPNHNPFMINVAQVVESAHCLEDSISLIEEILRRGLKDETHSVTPVEGRGVGVVEAPRGALFHDYTYDAKGRMTGANCIIPTGQNLANIEDDMRKAVPEILEMSDKDIAQRLKMLVRAYDPCISCSTHSIEVKFTRE